MYTQCLQSAYCVLTLLYSQPVLMKLMRAGYVEPLEEEGAAQPDSGGAWAALF